MKTKFNNSDEAIEFAYNNTPFEIPSVNWDGDSGFYFENLSQEEKENLQNWIGEKLEGTDLETAFEQKLLSNK